MIRSLVAARYRWRLSGLGLEAHASDLNPGSGPDQQGDDRDPAEVCGPARLVSTLSARSGKSRKPEALIDRDWNGERSGLAADVRYYGNWMRDEAKRRIGHLYPEVEVTPAMVRERSDLKPYLGQKLTVIAWLWASTVKSPNPAFSDVEVPLASTWMLSTKKGKQAYVEPVVDGRGYRFRVRVGSPFDHGAAKAGTKIARGAFRCLMSGVHPCHTLTSTTKRTKAEWVNV